MGGPRMKKSLIADKKCVFFIVLLLQLFYFNQNIAYYGDDSVSELKDKIWTLERKLSSAENNLEWAEQQLKWAKEDAPGGKNWNPFWIKKSGPPSFGERVSDVIEHSDELKKNIEDYINRGITWWTDPNRSKSDTLKGIAYAGTAITMVPLMTYLTLKATSATIDVIKTKLTTHAPVILLSGSKYGRTDRLKRWWVGYKTPPMIFDASVKERLEEIQEKTKNIRDHIYKGQKITYDNLLLYGPPGTGKTLFAQILADKTDMDFLPVTAASLLQSGVEGIKYFDELMMMANQSKYGTILFVDEADALFVDRDTLRPDSDHYKVLNHILAATGSGSNKFMLIAATNHAYVMDPAMGRRFQDRVLMPLPDENTRKELLNLYMNEQLYDTKNRSSQFVSAAHSILTTEKIDEIAKQTVGLSHAEIKDMVTIMGKKANATKDGIITQRNVDTAVSEAIEKKKALERDMLEKEKKNAMIRSRITPQIISEPESEAAPAA